MSFYKSQHLTESEFERTSTHLVEDLLKGGNEWKKVEDIVRLTIKALTDVVKQQGEILREIEHQLPTRASKQELQSALAMKANVNDVSKTIAEVSSCLDGKLSFDDTQILLKDFCLKSDVHYLLSQKVGIDEMNENLDQKISTNEFEQDFQILKTRIDDIQIEFNKKYNSCVYIKDFKNLEQQLELKANNSDMLEQLEAKANKQSVTNALHRKANKAEFEAMLATKLDMNEFEKYQNLIEGKGDQSLIGRMNSSFEQKNEQIQQLMNQLQTKASIKEYEQTNLYLQNIKGQIDSLKEEQLESQQNQKKTIENLCQSFQKNIEKELENVIKLTSEKTDKTELKQNKKEVKDKIQFIQNELSEFKKQQEEHFTKMIENNKKTETLEIERVLKTVRGSASKDQLQKLRDDVDNQRRAIDEILIRKLDKKELLEIKSQLENQLDNKTDLVEVQTALNQCQSEISNRFQNYKDEIRGLIRNQESEIAHILATKCDILDVNEKLIQKAEITIVNQLAHSKIGVQEFDELSKFIQKLVKELDNKVNFNEFLEQFNKNKEQFEKISKDLQIKSNIKDICVLLDSKANIEDVNKALKEIHSELDTKAVQNDVTTFLNDQGVINDSLCTENITGRWTWKSGSLKPGNVIPWEIQVINTLPDNYLWEKDKSSVLVVAPGLYEINFGFFSKKKPTVQLLLNGEPLLSAVNTASYVIHHSGGKVKDQKHSAGNITGLTMIDFIVIPARSRLSFTYTGEPGEGFFGLRRL